MGLLIAGIILLLFIWVFGEIADRIPEKRHMAGKPHKRARNCGN